jgi:RNA polymerase sigma-70 factor, ECF subfamily
VAEGDGPPGLESDRALLASFKKGERAALARVFDVYVDDVVRTIRAGVTVKVDGASVRVGKGIPEADVEALVQETFARAFAPPARDAYDGIRPYGAYLSTIARNLVVDRGRDLVRVSRRVAGKVDVETVADDEAADPSWRIEEEQLQQVLQTYQAKLDEPDKSIFRLRYEDQLSHPQTAKALGLSEVTVRRRDTRLRAALLDALRAAGFLRDAKVSIGQSLLGRRTGG